MGRGIETEKGEMEQWAKNGTKANGETTEKGVKRGDRRRGGGG